MFRRIISSLTDLALIRLRTLFKIGSEARDLRILFDATYYLVNYPDVMYCHWSPEWHYLLFGASEMRNPHPLFETAFYLESNPDVKRSKTNPLLHYILYGGREGRRTTSALGNLPSDPTMECASRNPLVRYILHKSRESLAPAFSARTLDPPTKVEPPAECSEGAVRTRPREVVSEEARLRLVSASRDLSQALAGCKSLVSVVIACHNYGKCVWDAIGSVLAQTYPHVEVVVVDDESTDPETIELLERIRHPRVTVIRQFNQGLAQTRNNGAAVARGSYLMFLDCDDRLDRHAVALLLYALQCNPTAAYAYPYQRFFGDQELVWATQAFNAYDLLWSNHPTVCSLIRRAAFDAVGGYSPEFFSGYEDWECFLRLSGHGHNGLCVPAPVFQYRRHGTTMSHSLQKRQSLGLGQMLAINSALFEPETITAVKRGWRPLISVIIPFYNSPRYLHETLESLRAQTTQDFEVILVNDGSSDPESLRVLDELRAGKWVRVLDIPHKGLPSARNHGAAAARAGLIMFLDSDDLLDSGAIEKLCWTIASQPQYAFVYSGVVHFRDVEAVSYNEFDAARLHRENFLAATCVMWRDVYLELGGNDPTMTRSWEDYDFWLRLVAKGYSGRLLREPLFHYRRHEGGMSRQLVKNTGVKLQEISVSVVSRHLAETDRQRPPLIPDGTPAPGLLERVAEALREALPPSIPTQSYRRPNLPNLFAPERWSSDRITILYLIPSFGVGGAEVFDLRILSCLPRDRFSVILVACERAEGALYEEFRTAVDEVFALQHMGDDRDARLAFLRYLMIAKCVNIVFNRNTFWGYELAAAWPDVSREVSYVDLLHLHAFGEDWVRVSAPYHEKLDLRYVTSGDLPAYAAQEYKVASNGFKALDFGFEPGELPDEGACEILRRSIRKKWNIPAAAFVVGFAGRLTDQKDPLRWMSIAAMIAEKRQNTFFLVVGDGELLDEAVAAAVRLGLRDQIMFTGYQREAASYCSAMDVLLMTSKYEGLPLMVLHALAHGTPVISSDVGSIGRCLGKRNGRVLATNAGEGSYAEAVLEWKELLESDLSIARQCREHVRARFCKSRMREQLVEDLSSLAAPLNREARRRDYQLDLMKRAVL
jgi:glycosyltransferase involved in cell wall biosynthesis